MNDKNTLQSAVVFSSLLMFIMDANTTTTTRANSRQVASTLHELKGNWRIHTACKILADGSREQSIADQIVVGADSNIVCRLQLDLYPKLTPFSKKYESI